MQGMRAPYLILCSDSDDLAPYHIICNFAQRLQDLGADVKIITWSGSPHVGLYSVRIIPDSFFFHFSINHCSVYD